MKERIIIVDDEPQVLKALERALTDESHEIMTFTSPKIALAEMIKTKCAVVTSDQRMPEMTGTEFLKKVAQLRPQTIRILLTGYADYDAVLAAINNAGVYRFLTKPWDDNELKEIFQNAVLYHKIASGISSLAKSFDDMVSGLQISNIKNTYAKGVVDKAYATLEGRVKEKTEDLRFVHRTLINEIARRKAVTAGFKAERNKLKSIPDAFPQGVNLSSAAYEIEYITPTTEREVGEDTGEVLSIFV